MRWDPEAGKALIQSKVFWGAILAGVAVFVPKIQPQIDGLASEIVTGVGLIMVVVGRLTAAGPITSLFSRKQKSG